MESEQLEKEPFLSAQDDRNVETSSQSAGEIGRAWWTFFSKHVLFHCCLIAIYTVAASFVLQNHTRSCKRPSDFDGLTFKYTDSIFHNLSQSPYTGAPSAENIAAWDELLAPMHMRVSEEELQRTNQESVFLPEGGGYLGWMGVFHELHCIKMLRNAHYDGPPSKSMTPKEKKHWESHIDHCFEMLRQSAVCHADASLTTFTWHSRKTRPMFNATESIHKCIDWNALMASAKDRIVEEDEILRLDNPVLAANGRR